MVLNRIQENSKSETARRRKWRRKGASRKAFLGEGGQGLKKEVDQCTGLTNQNVRVIVLVGVTAKCRRNIWNIFCVVREYFIAYCNSREAVNLFTFLLSPYSLVGTCNSV
jgi:hypothetical protein